MRKWRTALAVITTFVLAAAACGPTETGGGTTPTPAAEQPVPGGRVIEGRASDAQRLNPAISNDDGSSLINSKIYDSLVSVNTRTGEPIPWMGKWTVTPDNLTYMWAIDPKANWSPIFTRCSSIPSVVMFSPSIPHGISSHGYASFQKP